MKSILFSLLLSISIIASAQEKISTLNFLQAGAVPKTITERGKNINTSGLTFNYSHFEETKFFRMDATWLARYILNGTKDTTNFNDSNKVAGYDMPIFTATYGRNIIKGDNFSMGLGVNLDSRTFYSSPSNKAKKIIDAFNIGFVIGTKIKINDWITYSGFWGYDMMFTDASGSTGANGSQYYLQNNVSFLIKGKFGINLQPDFTFKKFDIGAVKDAQIFNKNIKVGLAYAIP
ncbi:MAG: hypothetical protein PSX81_09485 [bacterium]|nr:hypothetical protein [bacterium]